MSTGWSNWFGGGGGGGLLADLGPRTPEREGGVRSSLGSPCCVLW